MHCFKVFILIFSLFGYVSLSTAHFDQMFHTTLQKGLVLGSVAGLGLYVGLKTISHFSAENQQVKALMEENDGMFRKYGYSGKQQEDINEIEAAKNCRLLMGIGLTAGALCAALKLSKFSTVVRPTFESSIIIGMSGVLGGFMGIKTINELFNQPDESKISFPKSKIFFGVATTSALLSVAASFAYKK